MVRSGGAEKTRHRATSTLGFYHMVDVSQYIGLPFKCGGRDQNGLDCWGLVVLVYRDLRGIELPTCTGYESIDDWRTIRTLIDTECANWTVVETPTMFDVVLLKWKSRPWHVGIVVSPSQMLHVWQNINVCLEPFDGWKWGRHVVNFYRYG